MRGSTTMVLAISAGLLAAVVFAEVRMDGTGRLARALAEPGDPRAPAPEEQAERVAPRADPRVDWVPPDLLALANTRERPLFFEGRKYPDPPAKPAVEPTAIKVEPPKPTEPLGPVALSAIIITEEERVAILRSPTEGGTNRIQVGEELNGWELVELQPDLAIFEHGSQREEVKLRDYDKASPPPAPPNRRASSRPTRAQGRANPTAGARDQARGQLKARARSLLERRRNAQAQRQSSARQRARAVPPPSRPQTGSAGASAEGNCGLSRC